MSSEPKQRNQYKQRPHEPPPHSVEGNQSIQSSHSLMGGNYKALRLKKTTVLSHGSPVWQDAEQGYQHILLIWSVSII
jgi:hypothetical protein